MPSRPPALLVTIDTEPDDQWSRKPAVSTDNIQQVPRIQNLFDRHGVRPTYLVSYSVARDPRAVEILAAIQQAGRCEIGAHLHPWNTPPDHELGGPVWATHPYLNEYPRDVQRRKFETLHETLCETFGTRPVSYRAGRYGLDGHGVRLLADHGYRVDTSVTPMVCWPMDGPSRAADPDFRRAPVTAYRLSFEDVTRAGSSPVLEVPISIGLTRRLPGSVTRWVARARPGHPVARVLGRLAGVRKRWFRPILEVPLAEVEAACRWLCHASDGIGQSRFAD
jgi:peptidoglycan/xylan/chitin deacetylase (PgdA/CDA1 family)